MGLISCCNDVVLFCVKNIVGVLNDVDIELWSENLLVVCYEIVNFGFIVFLMVLL